MLDALNKFLDSRRSFFGLVSLAVLFYIFLDIATTLYCVQVFGMHGVNALDSELSPVIKFFGTGPMAVIIAKSLVGFICVTVLLGLSRYDRMVQCCNILAIALILMGVVAVANNILAAQGWPPVRIFGMPVSFIGLAFADLLEVYGISTIWANKSKKDKIEDIH